MVSCEVASSYSLISLVFYLLCYEFTSLIGNNCAVNNIRIDYKPILKLVELLIEAFLIPFVVGEKEGLESEASDKILQLMLGIIDGLYSTGDVAVIPSIASQWAPAFQLRCFRYLP